MKSEQHVLRLYESQRASLVSYATRLLGDRSRAEDIVHDAWLIFDQLPDRQAVRDPIAYLHRTVRNLSLNALRRIRHYQQISGADTVVAEQIADHAPSAEDQAIAKQALARFMERLALLPERQRIAIRMHRLEGKKMREIAAVLGVSIPMVHTLIADALVKCVEPTDRDD